MDNPKNEDNEQILDESPSQRQTNKPPSSHKRTSSNPNDQNTKIPELTS